MKNKEECKPKKHFFMNKLQNYRNRIDRIDTKLAALLKKREKIIHKIGLLKAKTKYSIKNKRREYTILLKLDTNFEKEVFKTILKESRKIQRHV